MMRRRSIRVQLTAAMVAIAVIATVTSMLIANLSLHDHLDSMVAHAFQQAERDAVAAELDRQHALAGVIAILFAVAVALLIGRRLSAPLSHLSMAADRLIMGELDVEVPRGGPSEVHRLANDFDRLRIGLAQEDRLRRQGFAELAHELRTPVTNIRARLEAAQDDVIPIEQGLPVISAEVERLGRLLDELSLLADLENPLKRHEVALVKLSEVVRRQGSLAEARATELDLQIETDSDPAVCVLGEKRRLEQVVCNLLSNAIAYSEPGATIKLTVVGTGRHAQLDVIDEGIGIAESDLPHVTRRFWRGYAARSRAGDGSGVGLAIVDEIVRAHHGELQLTSEPGHGTTARVLLPLAADS